VVEALSLLLARMWIDNWRELHNHRYTYYDNRQPVQLYDPRYGWWKQHSIAGLLGWNREQY
jgi:hypothetical protein